MCPNDGQKQLSWQTFGCCRPVFHYFWKERNQSAQQ
ncbi:helix-turn-helix domain-containing protein [Brevibacillus humidisoli]